LHHMVQCASETEVQEEPMSNLLVIHGPNLNLLGKREPHIYGFTTLDEINHGLVEQGKLLGLHVECFQSNHEGSIIDKIQSVLGKVDGIIINPAAFTHYSYAIRDALSALVVPVIEVHLSNVHAREPFRSHSVIAAIAKGQIVGLGAMGYSLALQAMHDTISKSKGETNGA
jgi:3-dehydroquinate dehydratase-2